MGKRLLHLLMMGSMKEPQTTRSNRIGCYELSVQEKRMADLERDAFKWEDEAKRLDEILEKIFELYLPNKDMYSTIKNVEARIRREKKKESEEATGKAMKELDETNEEEEEEEENEKQTMTSRADRDARKKLRDDAKAAREKEKKARGETSAETTPERPTRKSEKRVGINDSHQTPIKLRIRRSRFEHAKEKESTESEESSESPTLNSSPEEQRRRMESQQRAKAEEDKKRAEMKHTQRMRRDESAVGISTEKTGEDFAIVPTKQMRRSPPEETNISPSMRSLLAAVDEAIKDTERRGEGEEVAIDRRRRSPSVEIIDVVPADDMRSGASRRQMMEEREREERDEANRRGSSAAGPSRGGGGGGDERMEGGTAFVNQRRSACGEHVEMRERAESVDTRNMQNMRLEDEPMDKSSGRRSPESPVHSCDGPIDEAEIISNVEEKNDEENEQAESQQCDHDEEPTTSAHLHLYRARKDALYDVDEIQISNFEKHLHTNPATFEQKLKNIKFLAKYGLIYQEVECEVCKKKLTLMKETTDPARDGFVWKCTKCRDARHRAVEITVRTGCFFEGFNFSIGRILHLACIFMDNPRRQLHELAESLDSDIATVDHLRSYFLDISQELAFVNADKKRIGGWQKPLVDVRLGYIFKNKYEKDPARNFAYALVFKGVVEFVVVPVKNLDAKTLAKCAAKALLDGSEITVAEPQLFGSVAGIQKCFDDQFGRGRMLIRADFTRYPAEDVAALREGRSTRAQLALVDVVRDNLQKPFNVFLVGMSAYDVLERDLECGDDPL